MWLTLQGLQTESSAGGLGCVLSPVREEAGASATPLPLSDRWEGVSDLLSFSLSFPTCKIRCVCSSQLDVQGHSSLPSDTLSSGSHSGLHCRTTRKL